MLTPFYIATVSIGTSAFRRPVIDPQPLVSLHGAACEALPTAAQRQIGSESENADI